MSDFTNRSWFGLFFQPHCRTPYLCYARNIEQAVEFFGVLAEGRKVVQLSWGWLSELTGCLIPCQCKPDDVAKGNLMFQHKGKFITIWNSVI